MLVKLSSRLRDKFVGVFYLGESELVIPHIVEDSMVLFVYNSESLFSRYLEEACGKLIR